MKLVSALIQHHVGPTGAVLICKKTDGAWEFPTIQARTNESGEDAVIRLAAELLGMTVKPGKLAMIGRQKPNDGYVEHLACGNITHNTNSKDNYHEYYEAINTWQTEPKSCVYAEFKWVHPSELAAYEFAGDDKNFMAKYDPWINGKYIPDVRMY